MKKNNSKNTDIKEPVYFFSVKEYYYFSFYGIRNDPNFTLEKKN